MVLEFEAEDAWIIGRAVDITDELLHAAGGDAHEETGDGRCHDAAEGAEVQHQHGDCYC